MTNSERNTSPRNNQPKIVVHWEHTQEIMPAFIRLMTVLLRERIGNGKKTRRESNRPNYQVL